MRSCWVVLAALALVAGACGGKSGSKTSATTTPPAALRPGPPNILLMKPFPGATVKAGDVEVIISVGHFKIVKPRPGLKNSKGQGHVHFYVDVEALPISRGTPAVPADKSKDQVSTSSSVTWRNVARGTHSFSAQLVNNDETPLSPPVTATVRVRVQ